MKTLQRIAVLSLGLIAAASWAAPSLADSFTLQASGTKTGSCTFDGLTAVTGVLEFDRADILLADVDQSNIPAMITTTPAEIEFDCTVGDVVSATVSGVQFNQIPPGFDSSNVNLVAKAKLTLSGGNVIPLPTDGTTVFSIPTGDTGNSGVQMEWDATNIVGFPSGDYGVEATLTLITQ